MKTTKRISVSLLVLVMVLSAVLAIPASAGSERHYFTNQCSCGYTFSAYAQSTFSGATVGYAQTSLDHAHSPVASDGKTTVSATIWHYPSTNSSAYNTAHVSASATGLGSVATCDRSQGYNVGTIFCIESNHYYEYICGGVKYSDSMYISNGEPAMK